MEKRPPSRRQLIRSALLSLTTVFVVGQTGAVNLAAQGVWPFRLEWEQVAVPGMFHRLCVNGDCSIRLSSTQVASGRWRAPLPLLPVGEHRLVLEACVQGDCVPGSPDMVVRVLPPSPRRGPIDVISGPRIPINR